MERWRVLHGACLSSFRRPGDFDYEDGAMPALPFSELLAALEPEQLVSLGWLAMADLAVWPQLPEAERDGLLSALRLRGEISRATGAMSASATSKPSISVVALAQVAAFLRDALTYQADPTSTPPAGHALRAAVEQVARASARPGGYWEDWLIRVIPRAATLPAPGAHADAVRGLECQLTVPATFAYEASLSGSGKEAPVHVVTPRMGGEIVSTLGHFENFSPESRAIRARFVPDATAEPIDPYRMGYLFRTTLMGTFYQDHYEGRYDDVLLTHATTGDAFHYEAL